MTHPRPFTAIVVGGSVGGLAAALELRGIGADVSVYERSVDRTEPRGAGIVMQPEVQSLLARIGVTVPEVSVLLHERRHLRRDGSHTSYAAPQWMTAWDTLYQTLRRPLGDTCYRLGSILEGIDHDGAQIAATFGDGSRAHADLLIGADGVGSATRTLLGINGKARYGGYIACRGLELESDLPDHLVEFLAERFTFFGTPGMQLLCYLVPGADGSREPGSRRVNWVWYVNTPEAELPRLFTGPSGRRFDFFLPRGQLTADSAQRFAMLADHTLPPQFAELVGHSALFLQPVADLGSERMLADRSVLIGDAAGTVRPHTASGTSKAMGDAASLAHVLRGWRAPEPPPTPLLDRWERSRLDHLRAIARSGLQMASQSMLGVTGSPQFLHTASRTTP
jgi:2-polyprenyl-6-methoxyphenol hydroxylase-like FAD-dependent oxidoreductase